MHHRDDRWFGEGKKFFQLWNVSVKDGSRGIAPTGRGANVNPT